MVERQPELRTRTVQSINQLELNDDVLIDFGALTTIVGIGFPLDDESGLNVGGWDLTTEGTPLLKQWHVAEDGRQFLIESITWREVAGNLDKLANAQRANNAGATGNVLMQARVWPLPVIKNPRREPMQVASSSYQGRGYVLDFVIIPDAGTPNPFVSGTTYYVKTSYYSSASVVFQPGCCIKFKNNAYMLLYGQISFPETQQVPVFTSRNDDGFGDKIVGVPGEADSNGDPSLHRAAQAIWSYYVNFSTTVQNVRIRWAQKGVQYDGSNVTQYIVNSSFEQCQTAVENHLTGSGFVYLSGVSKCSVQNPLGGYGNYSGTMTDALFCFNKVVQGLKIADFPFPLVSRPPDSTGAVGPNHFVVMVNAAIAAYDKANGTLSAAVDQEDFFPNTTNPHDSRIVYDQSCSRWVACTVDGAKAILALSTGSNPLPFDTSNWSFFTIATALPGFFADFPTLGVDANGIYVGINFFDAPQSPTAWYTKVVPIRKQNCLVTESDVKTPLDVTSNPNEYFVVQPAVNYDPVSDGLAWFVAKDQPLGTVPQGPIVYGKLQWTLINGQWTSAWASGQFASGSITIPQNYYDFDRDTGSTIRAPQKPYDATHNQRFIFPNRSYLTCAVVRNGFLWTCHTIALNQNGSYIQGEAASNLRSAIRWFKMQLSPTVSISATGQIVDGRNNPYWYMLPSLAVNALGDMIIGFAGTRGTEYPGAFVSGVRSSGGIPANPILLQAGRSYYNDYRWNDYTGSTVDPNGLSLWTIQTYGESVPVGDNPALAQQYGTVIVNLVKNP
jgi:hypothetical protein